MPSEEITGNTQRIPKKRGPKPKPIEERPYKQPKPISRVQRSYSRERKIEVILYLLHHRIQDDQNRRIRSGESRIGAPGATGATGATETTETTETTEPADSTGITYRAPTYHEASAHFKIPATTIAAWWKQKDKITSQEATAEKEKR
jgi:hypothetical protein